MDPRKISIQDFTYALPENRIAQYPLAERDASRLLVYREGKISDAIFKDLSDYLEPNDLLVFNDTRVIRARLLYRKPTGSRIELLLLDPANGVDPTQALQVSGTVEWKSLIGNAKRWKPEESLVWELPLAGRTVQLQASKGDQQDDTYFVRFSWNSPDTFGEILEAIGRMPLPPYMDRDEEPEDAERYQTVYARLPGSVAAPTAGLHFTERVFSKLRERSIGTDWLTLHVGAGTFKPVKTPTMEEHPMHRERIIVRREFIERLIHTLGRGRIVAVGTTSMRTLESLCWFGYRLLDSPQRTPEALTVEQWEPYRDLVKHSPKSALEAILRWLDDRGVPHLSGHTRLLIAPGYRFQLIDGIVTNFHQPESTLLLLIGAFLGEEWKTIYHHALSNDYRFLSYGDSSLLWRKQTAHEKG
jgi:S-adenosylmethionine:tRNA ribosyltransferase-isomerase